MGKANEETNKARKKKNKTRQNDNNTRCTAGSTHFASLNTLTGQSAGARARTSRCLKYKPWR
jgi:hypothetical protein